MHWLYRYLCNCRICWLYRYLYNCRMHWLYIYLCNCRICWLYRYLCNCRTHQLLLSHTCHASCSYHHSLTHHLHAALCILNHISVTALTFYSVFGHHFPVALSNCKFFETHQVIVSTCCLFVIRFLVL
jgi:hypothetical protein